MRAEISAVLLAILSPAFLLSCSAKEPVKPVPEPASVVGKAFFTALPEGTLVNGIDSGNDSFTLRFNNGSSIGIPGNRSALLQISSDGYWMVNGVKSNFLYASQPLYRADPSSGTWLRDGVTIGMPILSSSVTYGEEEVTSIVELSRNVSVNFSDGTSLSFPKNISWGMYVQKTASHLYIYMGKANSGSWIRHDFYYRNKAYTGGSTYPDYYDNWGLGKPVSCTRSGGSFSLGEELFLAGEAEAAVQTYDAREPAQKTYSGGVLHGWENICLDGSDRLFNLKIDGNTVGETGAVSLQSASLVEIEQTSLVARAYSPKGPENAYAKATKKWTFQNGTVTIRVEYEFLSETQLFQSMFGMFCVKRLRAKGDTSSGYITNLAWKDNTPYKMYEVTEGWESAVSASTPLKSKDKSTTRVEEFGEAGISFAMQYDGGTLKSLGGFKIGTNGNNYNKIYFDLTGAYTATVGEKLYSTVHWEIDYMSDYLHKED